MISPMAVLSSQAASELWRYYHLLVLASFSAHNMRWCSSIRQLQTLVQLCSATSVKHEPQTSNVLTQDEVALGWSQEPKVNR